MAQGIIGQRAGNAIIPYDGSRKRTKVLDLSGNITTTGVTFSSCSQFDTIFYTDSDDNWRVRFNGRVAVSGGATTSGTIDIANIVFKSGSNQSISSYGFAGATAVDVVASYTKQADDYLQLNYASSSMTELIVSGDVALNAEPTTYTTAANLETTGADNYIQPASDTVPGLVSTSAQTMGAGVKTFSDGINLGDTNLTAYEEGTTTVTLNGATTGTSYATGRSIKWTKVGKQVTVSLTIGVDITTSFSESGIQVRFLPASAHPSEDVETIAVSDFNGTSKLCRVEIFSSNGAIKLTSLDGTTLSAGHTWGLIDTPIQISFITN